jgi:hypothetical protein
MDVLADFGKYLKLRLEEERDHTFSASALKDPTQREIHQYACICLHQLYEKYCILFPACEEETA